MAEPIHSLWIGSIGQLEQLSMCSFMARGHRFVLYAYDDIGGIPPGVDLRDAGEILPRELIFYYKGTSGSPAGFANWFRYELLHRYGGWWADLDVVCLKHFDFTAEHVFGWESANTVNNAVMKAPKGSELLRVMIERSRDFRGDGIHGSTGPFLLTPVVKELGMETAVCRREVFYPISFGRCRDAFTRAMPLPRDSHAVHLWHSGVTRCGIDIHASAEGSIYRQLLQMYMPERCFCPGRCACAPGGDDGYAESYRRVLALLKPGRVFEWGRGRNTGMALEAGARVVSVEHQEKSAHPRHESLVQIDMHAENDFYVRSGAMHPSDLYFVDGRKRVLCMDCARENGPPDHVLCLHDAQRERYRGALDRYEHVLRLPGGFAVATNDKDIHGRLAVISPPQGGKR